ncbi:MAG: DNA translocase FtsK 4TM domain-containing protein [Rhodomicrobium sp.]
MQTLRRRFLPKVLAIELRRLPWRLLGLALVAAAVICWLSLLSWSYADPSPNYATGARPQNWLGRGGASLAGTLMEGFGLASALLVVPVAALGLQIATGFSPIRPRLRLLYWAVAAFAFSGFFACFPVPQRWVLASGLGGITGDFAASRIAKLAPILPSFALWPVGALFFFALGIDCLWRASGWNLQDLFAAFKGALANDADALTFEEGGLGENKQGFANRLTSWVKHLSSRGQALILMEERPPLMEVRKEPPLTPAERIRHAGGRSIGEAPPYIAPDVPNFGTRGRTEIISGFSPAKGERDEDGDVYDDDRIEPFFGPRRGQTFPGGAGSHNGYDHGSGGPSLPRLRTKAGGSNGAQAFSSAKSTARSGRAPIYPKAAATAYAHAVEEETKEDFISALPSMALLAPPPRPRGKVENRGPELAERAAALMEVLGDFGVKGRISGIYPGPVITLFELEPARGTKSARVVGLGDDIARSMSAVSARVAVVPGRDAIGIELPNMEREAVHLRAILESGAFQNTQAVLPLALGKSIGGEPVVADLARMPHLLIAGTTGSGKSVGVNAMILSLIYKLPPRQCNFIMIDPKMLELSVYDGIPHLLAPVVTNPKQAVAALKWAVNEMNIRYQRMSKLGVRSISSYNAKIAAAQLRGQSLREFAAAGFDPQTDEALPDEEVLGPAAMPYIVVVIDEMADLMMCAGKEVEFAVQRLSQMARAAGIHLIMATQRPSVDVVTGTIKANFPSRISFQVSSKIDSRTIIGEQGAEQLLGAGDLLYMAAGGRIIRAHGPFVSEGEVERVARWLKTQGAPSYRQDILEDAAVEGDGSGTRGNSAGESDLYERAVEIVLSDRKPTTSYLQRRLGIGYNRAASLIERMENEGIIGAPGRTGRREILLEDRP